MRQFEIMKNKWYLSVFIFLFGAILSLAFAPFGYEFLAVFSLAMLLFVWTNNLTATFYEPEINQAKDKNEINSRLNISHAKANAIYGFLFGLGFFGFSVYWVYISIHNYGNANAILAIIITLSLIAYLAIFIAVLGFIFTKIFPQNNFLKIFIVFPSLWTLFEFLRGWLFTGFPWMFIGYSQIDAPLRGYAPFIGVYGISFLVAFTASALVVVFKTKKFWQRLIIIILTILIWICGAILAKIDWTKSDKEFKVSLIQANVAQELKWQILERDNILQKYFDLTKNNLHNDIIVWPEAAIPAFPDQVKSFLHKIAILAKNNHSTIISGIPINEQINNSDVYFNAMISVGTYDNKYLKRHLVPFGEYVPLEFVFSNFMNYFAIPMSNFIPGNNKQPDFVIDSTTIAPFICYEIAYPYLVLDYLPKAGLLLTISDDSWFGKSIALAQHLEIARMRSLETGRYQLVVANTGLTAIIDSFGKVIAKAPAFNDFVVNGKIPIKSGSTPWICFGHYLWILLAIVCFIIAWHNQRKKSNFDKKS